MREFDAVVIGGGAAGLMAAGVAASAGRRVLLCEKMEKPARKVRITGKGRCNLTNMRPPEEFLSKVKGSPDFFARSFAGFSNRDAVDFFVSIGVPLIVERGERVFPASGKAWDIAEAHVKWCRNMGVDIECNTKITDIYTEKGRVTGVMLAKKSGQTEKILAKNVIIATGGMSYPATGSTGEGYMLAHNLGHTVVGVRPTLVPLESPSRFMKPLGGLSLKNTGVKLIIDGRVEGEEFGDMEFTGSGVGGPVVLRLSRKAVDAVIEERRVKFSIDLKPALDKTKLLARINREIDKFDGNSTLHDIIRTMLPAKMILPFIDSAGLSAKLRLSSLGDAEKMKIVTGLKDFAIDIDDYRPFKEAIVTAGGVSTDEVDVETLQSKLVKGLYFAGEVLDIDADTGGYNLQIAYSTGYLAGKLL